ncbi:hypothetical protein COO58_03780 [Micromonospora sp. WMMA1996]|nr:hypothetical protein COO58_03780 [Micromonospora sp. WMMA1996]
MAVPVRSVVFATAEDLATQTALEIARGLRAAASAGRLYLLGCPSGRSATRTFRVLAEVVAERRIPVSGLVVVALDAYVQTVAGRFVPVPADRHHSCERYVTTEVVGPLNRGLRPPDRIPAAQIWVPGPDRPADLDARIREHGGMDLLILASGSGDGHVGFNGPGSARQSVTRVVRLEDSTRRDNLRTYPAFGSVGEVPTHGVTMGIATMADLAHRAVLLLPGAEKAAAFRRVRRCRDYDPEWPSSVVAACADGVVYADVSAAHGRD